MDLIDEMQDGVVSALDALRAEFMELAKWKRQTGEWSAADAREIGQAAEDAIAGGDQGVIACWQAWIGKQLEEARRLKAMAGVRMRALEASIRAARKVAA